MAPPSMNRRKANCLRCFPQIISTDCPCWAENRLNRITSGRLSLSCKKVRAQYPGKTIWCYTGYTLESDLLSESRARCECTDEMLSLLDVLVDGEFIEAQKNISLAFRGSENQRLIDVPATLSSGSVVWHGLVSQNISMKY